MAAEGLTEPFQYVGVGGGPWCNALVEALYYYNNYYANLSAHAHKHSEIVSNLGLRKLCSNI